jgi:iron complex outermembrane receptor protein
VYAQTQNAGNTPISEYVTVTGSHISRLDVAGAVPVVSITRDDIERSGVMTVGELLQQSPMDNGGTFNDTANNTFAAGGTGVSLRGLGANTVLVLINGRRATNYGFANRNATFTSFVDLNSIPLGIV